MSLQLGKVRGKVVRTDDPLNIGRIMVTVPSVLGRAAQVWAMPCVAYAGPGVGLVLTPPRGANVWIEFEGGQIDSPIWTGGFWDRGEYPLAAGAAETRLLKTGSIELRLEDSQGGGITLTLGSPASNVPMTLRAKDGAVTISARDSRMKISPGEISLEIGGSRVVLTTSSAMVRQGSAKVQLSAGSVSLNDGELQVG
jgi:hypothetical protein